MRRSILKPSSLLELSIQVASSSPAPLSRGSPSPARDKRKIKIRVGKKLRFELNASFSFVLFALNTRDTIQSFFFSPSNGSYTRYHLLAPSAATLVEPLVAFPPSLNDTVDGRVPNGIVAVDVVNSAARLVFRFKSRRQPKHSCFRSVLNTKPSEPSIRRLDNIPTATGLSTGWGTPGRGALFQKEI